MGQTLIYSFYSPKQRHSIFVNYGKEDHIGWRFGKGGPNSLSGDVWLHLIFLISSNKKIDMTSKKKTRRSFNDFFFSLFWWFQLSIPRFPSFSLNTRNPKAKFPFRPDPCIKSRITQKETS